MRKIAILFTLLSIGLALSQPEGTLRLYTSQPDADAAATAAAFEAAYPDVNVTVFRSGTEQVIARFLLEVEAGESGADVLLLADAPTFELLKERELLQHYEPQGSTVPEEFIDPDGYWFGTKAMATLIMYNTSLVAEPVTSWTELAELPAGQIIMPSPSYSGAAAYNLGVFTRDERLGWAWFEALAGNDVTLVQGNGAVLRGVAEGERPYGVVVDYLPIRAIPDGSPVDVVYAAEGVPVITEPVAIVSGTPNREAAEAFVDFLVSEAGQQLSADLGYLPLSDSVEPPAGFTPLSTITVLHADAAELASGREADKERFAELFGE